MTNFRFLHDAIDQQTLEALEVAEKDASNNFEHLVAILKLNPKTDFVGANLRGVDFSRCNLKDFDFTNADLRGSKGVEIEFPEIGKLRGALVEGSPFQYVLHMQAISDRVEAHLPPSLLDNSDSLSTSNWIHKNTAANSRLRNAAILLAIQNMEHCTDVTILSDTIYSVSNYFRSETKFLDFIRGWLARANNQESVVVACLRVMVARYPNRDYTKRLLLDFLVCEQRYEVLRVVVSLLRKLNLTYNERQSVADFIFDDSQESMRRNILFLAVRGNLDRFEYLFDGRKNPESIFDFSKEISDMDLDKWIKHIEFRVRRETRFVSYSDRQNLRVAKSSRSDYELLVRRITVEQLLDDLALISVSFGVPLRFHAEGKRFLDQGRALLGLGRNSARL